jgi:hypothetical protein
MKLEVVQTNMAANGAKPKPYWLAVYAPVSSLTINNEDIGSTPIDSTDEPFVVFDHQPTKDDLVDMQGEGEVLLVVLKVTP